MRTRPSRRLWFSCFDVLSRRVISDGSTEPVANFSWRMRSSAAEFSSSNFSSCVFFDASGTYLDALYFGNTACFNGAATHSGDARTGEEALGEDEADEFVAA